MRHKRASAIQDGVVLVANKRIVLAIQTATIEANVYQLRLLTVVIVRRAGQALLASYLV